MRHLPPKVRGMTRANGLAIRAIREAKHITLRGLAKTAGISNQYLSRIEREDVDAPLETLHKIAEALGVNWHAISRTQKTGQSPPPPEDDQPVTEPPTPTVP